MSKTIRSAGQAALCDALIKARQSAELTQTQLAERLRCHQSMIARVESGERRIDTVELIVICRAIGCDPKDILDHVDAAVPVDHHL
ncbi:helix-turn-helix domain-containing protein [Donghicola eburneus]|uniref:XRE family transcriptional regulator n=1 Tax=Donghicola eburneus TaxID=393278 RepID=A0A1M4N250_9RHOB|nr:helix-turn-helix transcriptional regulator [Donghicola eburneus]SCM68118.1 XRE family transcriptional regulator [Donghicola eburneus]